MTKNTIFQITSKYLQRVVRCRHIGNDSGHTGRPVTIIFNDGQDFPILQINLIYKYWESKYPHRPIQFIGIDAGDRMNEYGTITRPDYKNRGHKAPLYREFMLVEFLPYIRKAFQMSADPTMNAFVGFSLGGLSAFDFTIQHPEIFKASGVFSGSFWWRHEPFTEVTPDDHRIMHEFVESHTLYVGQRFWFQAGTLDETSDRNYNGIIDSIDDTLHLMEILEQKGLQKGKYLHYHEVIGGTHDPMTWGKAMPAFLDWYYNE